MTAYEIRAATEDEQDRLALIGQRVKYAHGGFSGTVLQLTREGDPIVHWDTHFGSPVQDAPRALILRPFDKQGDVEPFDVEADWAERA